MAKRKRLTPARPDYLAPAPMTRLSGPLTRAPIADVAGETAAAGAFAEVAGELERARAEGRLVVALEHMQIDTAHLLRDRMHASSEEFEALKASLLARGQQSPIEVEDLGEGRYGLISGWRRLIALMTLHADTGEERFARVLAIVRRPEDRAGAYVAMVEENEIREGLTFYERARIVRLALDAGVFETEKAALQSLFAAASYSKRSKIKSYLPLVGALDGALRHPAGLPEHLGLALARRLREDPDLAARLRAELTALDSADAEGEARCLAQAVKGSDTPRKPPAPAFHAVAPGIALRAAAQGVTLKGPGLTPELIAELETWLRQRV